MCVCHEMKKVFSCWHILTMLFIFQAQRSFRRKKPPLGILGYKSSDKCPIWHQLLFYILTVWIEAASYPKECFWKSIMHRSHMKDLFARCHPQSLWFSKSWGLRICISHKFPSNANDASSGTIIWDPLL